MILAVGSTVVRVLDHLALQVADVDAAAAFYVEIFAPLEVRELMRFAGPQGPVVGLGGPDGRPQLWFGPLVDRGVRPVHLALSAPLGTRWTPCRTPPNAPAPSCCTRARLWPEYHPGYYGVFLRDPDGNNVEAVHHTWS